MKKVLFPIFAAVLIAFAIMPLATGTVFATEAGFIECDGFKYWIDPDSGTAEVEGRAEGNDDAEISIPASITYNGDTYAVTTIYGFSDDDMITKLTVADGITEISGDAFQGCTNLADISLPDSITAIDRNSFMYTAYYVNDGNWIDGVLYIGKCLIAGKPEVTNCAVREGTVTIAAAAFCEGGSNTFGLTTLSIPASVVKIGFKAFANCNNLSDVTFAQNSNLREIAGAAFLGCTSLSGIKIPASVDTIGGQAFTETGLTSIVLPEGLTLIDVFLFEDCANLKEVTIPSTVTSIEMSAFNNTALTTIHFGGSPSQWAAITGPGKPADELVKDYGKEDVFVDASLQLSVYKNGSWIDADDPAYVTSATINGTSTRTAQVPVGVKTTITITPAAGYMVSGVKVNESITPELDVKDYQSQTDQETGVRTITFTPEENKSYAFSVSLQEAVRVTYDLNGGTTDDSWRGNTRLMSKGSVVSSIGYEFEKITPPEGQVLSAVEIKDGYGTVTVSAADLNNTAYSYDSDVTFKCIWSGSEPQPAEQTITASDFTKTYGNTAFNLNATTDGDGVLTYTSSNTKVAVVSSDGTVTIKGAGTATIMISASATANYKEAAKTITVIVNKAANTLKIKAKTATVKGSTKGKEGTLKKTKTLGVTKVIKFTNKGQGTKTYVKKSGNKKITIAKKTGKVTVKKGLKKGTYKVKVKVKAKGNANYKASTWKYVTFKIRVR